MVRRGARATGGFLADFRDFIMRGNVIDLAVAVIIGAAFGKIVESLVADIITPAILNPAMNAAGVDQLSQLSAGGIKYGLFIAAVLNFLVIAFCLFLLIRAFEAAKKRVMRREEIAEEEAPAPEILAQERLTTAVERLTETIERRNPGSGLGSDPGLGL
ncbi:large conductance mechanosensitive channel protein MscL [Myxosarcina sp. GI1]|uniref:large conductance mechanosensitive channel protein MscL n=1 Tax=Myxosarcina sp. GI1 TaxID=1541065 RepID=UPI00056C5CA3|nr:large conductance mechanosensitive channel protein MscL [Myxosarcina sp. GI1]